MSSARRLYRLNLLFAMLGLAAVTTVGVAAASTISVSLGSPAEIAAACRRMLAPHITGASLVALAVAALLGAVAYRGARSLARELRAQRRFLAHVVGPTRGATVAGTAVRLFPSDAAHTFCAGILRPRIYLSTAARTRLSTSELEAVLAHESHHRSRRDPLRLMLARVLADALFFLPALRRVCDRYAALAEVAADEAAVLRAGERPLASALLVFGQADRSAPVVGIAPERVDHLLGSPPRWQLPVLILGLSAVTALSVIALAVTVAASATAVSVKLPMLLAEACMVAMTAGPLLLLVGALVLSRRLVVRQRA